MDSMSPLDPGLKKALQVVLDHLPNAYLQEAGTERLDLNIESRSRSRVLRLTLRPNTSWLTQADFLYGPKILEIEDPDWNEEGGIGYSWLNVVFQELKTQRVIAPSLGSHQLMPLTSALCWSEVLRSDQSVGMLCEFRFDSVVLLDPLQRGWKIQFLRPGYPTPVKMFHMKSGRLLERWDTQAWAFAETEAQKILASLK